MTKEIEQLAREASAATNTIMSYQFDGAYLEVFADLVREAYRKELLSGVGEPVATKTEGGAYGSITLHIPWDETPGGTKLHTASQVAAAVLRERNRLIGKVGAGK